MIPVDSNTQAHTHMHTYTHICKHTKKAGNKKNKRKQKLKQKFKPEVPDIEMLADLGVYHHALSRGGGVYIVLKANHVV